MEKEIIDRESLVTFIDNYTVWVTGNHIKENQLNLLIIIDKVFIWERRSGTTFEEEKTAYIHFTRNSRLLDTVPIDIKGTAQSPQQKVKILGILIDLSLHYKNHRIITGAKSLKIAIALKRIRSLVLSSVR